MSTVVSVCVEALHKFFGLRASGMNDMLQALHDTVVMPLDPHHRDVNEPINDRKTSEGKEFAKAMTRSPSYSRRSTLHWLANIPLLGLLRRRFQNLSKIQFVEQLSLTDYGKRLANYDRDEVREHLNRTVYEFDRFGAAQTDYFRARAKILTSVIAFLIVIVGNFNAISIYLHLATNQSAVQSLRSMVTSNPEAITRMVESRMDKFASDGQTLTAAVAGDNVAGDQAAKAQARQIATQLVTDIQDLSEMGFPVGRSYFPYCTNTDNNGCKVPTWDGFAIKKDWVEKNTWWLTIPGNRAAWEAAHPGFAADVAMQGWQSRAGDRMELTGLKADELLQEYPPVRYFNLFGYQSTAIPRILTPEGIQWIIGMLATAGLIGLGAPFWFGLFQSMASVAMRSSPQLAAMKQAQLSQAPRSAPGEVKRPPEPVSSLAAHGSDPDLDLLTDAFLTVSGKMAGSTPVGRKLGMASADRIAVQSGQLPGPPGGPNEAGVSSTSAPPAASYGVGATAGSAGHGPSGSRGIRKFRTR